MSIPVKHLNDLPEIESLKDIPNPSISEELFVDFVLPNLLRETTEVFMSRWLEVIDIDPRVPVDVIGSDNRRIFTMPPLVDPEIENTESIFQIMDTARETISTNELKAQHLLTDVLSKAASVSEKHMSTYRKAWVEILQHYNVKPRSSVKPQEQKSSKQLNELFSDEEDEF